MKKKNRITKNRKNHVNNFSFSRHFFFSYSSAPTFLNCLEFFFFFINRASTIGFLRRCASFMNAISNIMLMYVKRQNNPQSHWTTRFIQRLREYCKFFIYLSLLSLTSPSPSPSTSSSSSSS